MTVLRVSGITWEDNGSLKESGTPRDPVIPEQAVSGGCSGLTVPGIK